MVQVLSGQGECGAGGLPPRLVAGEMIIILHGLVGLELGWSLERAGLESLWSRWHLRPWEDLGFSLGPSIFKGVGQGQGLVQWVSEVGRVGQGGVGVRWSPGRRIQHKDGPARPGGKAGKESVAFGLGEPENLD